LTPSRPRQVDMMNSSDGSLLRTALRQVGRALVGSQWLVLVSIVIVDVIRHDRGARVRTLEGTWLIILLFSFAFILSARHRLAMSLVFYSTSLVNLLFWVFSFVPNGLTASEIAWLAYVAAVLGAATVQFRRDGVLFGPRLGAKSQ
jgi:hypothetical protein